MPLITVYMRNNDPFGNNVKAWDKNRDSMLVFDGQVGPRSTQPIDVLATDAGFASVASSTDNNPVIGHPWLKNGDSFDV